MTKDILKTTSKYLSFILRHQPESIGLTLDENGWAEIDALIAKAAIELTPALIEEVVSSNDKKRFALSEDGVRVRANQGHSVKVDLQLAPQVPPAVLFHGTASQTLEAIRSQGLLKGSRQHVHLSKDPDTARRVGQRHGKPVVLRVSSGEMHAAGKAFYLSENGVWLCEHVSPSYLASDLD